MLPRGVCTAPEPILGLGSGVVRKRNCYCDETNAEDILLLRKNKITAASRGWNGVARYCYCHIDELEGVVFEPGGLGVGTPPTLLLPPYPPLAREITPPSRGVHPGGGGHPELPHICLRSTSSQPQVDLEVDLVGTGLNPYT